MDATAPVMTAPSPHAMPEGDRLSIPFYLAVGLIAGAIIAYQIAIMRVFSIGTWAHFGSFVVSIAMLGFGVMSAIMCIGTGIFQRRWGLLIKIALLAFGPLMVLGNTLAQAIGFNPIALASDPQQKFKLFHLFLLYFVPFLPGALFLGLVFLRGQKQFNKVYFADLVGSGLCGLAFLAATYLIAPNWIIMIPVAMWLAGALIWFGAARQFISAALALLLTVAAVMVTDRYVQIDVNQFKGVSYAQKFPDSKRIYTAYGPFGFLEVFASSYFHFAPGLSDNAALNLEQMPKNAYLGLYIDSDGPIGLIKDLSKSQSAYFEYLPMSLPYALKKSPDVFIVQLGGAISTEVALHMGAKRVVVAEGNPTLLRTLRDEPEIRKLTGDPLRDKRVKVIPYDGRLYVRGQRGRFDVIDLSLADSTGLSHPGGFTIHEKYNYTIETLRAYMAALKPDGILSITLWNKEDPPKSVPKLFATVLKAAAAEHGGKIADKFFITHVYLSTVTVLYKRNGFSAADLATIKEANEDLSFVPLYHPGFKYDPAGADKVFEGYRASYIDIPGRKVSKDRSKRPNLSATNLYRLMLHHMIAGRFDLVRAKYVFDTRPLTDDRPYFAAYIKAHEIPEFLNQLDAVSDEWGYLLLWATLVIAALFGAVLMSIPVIWGWRTIFLPATGQGRDNALLHVSGHRLHHCRGRADQQIHTGAGEPDSLGIGADHRHVAVLRARKSLCGPLCRPLPGSHAEGIYWHWSSAGPWCHVLRRGARRHRHLALLDPHRRLPVTAGATCFSDGFPVPHGDDHVGPARQGALLHLGLGHQRFVFGRRRRLGANRRGAFWAVECHSGRSGALPHRLACLFLGFASARRRGRGLSVDPADGPKCCGDFPGRRGPDLRDRIRPGSAADRVGSCRYRSRGGKALSGRASMPADIHRPAQACAVPDNCQ